jgi:hypothetical protein
MMAKIVKGQGFKGVVNYVLDKSKQTRLLDSQGVRTKSPGTIVQNFVFQAELNPIIKKPVGHISLDFSAQDKLKLSDETMVQVSHEYMQRMGIRDTQYIIARHFDKEHPHVHLVFNRVDNNGKTISDQNDRYRSGKTCKVLTEKYGLYFSPGKENVKTHRLKEPDKTKYEIYESLKSILSGCHNWDQIITALKEQDIEVTFIFRGRTSEVQGVTFSKNGYTFNGSKVDRQFSFSKIVFQLKQNIAEQVELENVNPSQIPDKYIAGRVLTGLLYQMGKQNEYKKANEKKKKHPRIKKRGKGMKM